MLDFDKILQDIGSFGFYQKSRVTVILVMASLLCGYAHFVTVFMLFHPEPYCPGNRAINGTEVCENCKNNVSYDTSIFGWTVVSEFGLICDRRWIIDILIIATSIGDLIGTIAFGVAGDIFGRKPLFYIAVAMFLVSGAVAYTSGSIVHAFFLAKVVHGERIQFIHFISWE